jgi:hypothetical protein
MNLKYQGFNYHALYADETTATFGLDPKQGRYHTITLPHTHPSLRHRLQELPRPAIRVGY